MNALQILLDFIEFIILLAYTIYSYFEEIFKYLFPKPLKSLEKEVILITGSGRGIGREICLELADTGAKIVCWSRTEGPNENVVNEIKIKGGEAFAYTVDVGNREKVREAAEKVKREVGDVTMIVNNAGLMKVSSFLQTSPEEITQLFNVNVMSNFWILREFLPGMLERGKGHIVSVCSASGLLPCRNIVAYSATKHAVHGYMESLRDEIRNYPNKPNIKLTTAYPFYCSTEMLDEAIPNTRFPFLFPIITPQDTAKSVVEGIRRDIEYIYTPRSIGWLAMFSWLVTTKAIAAHGDFLRVNIDPKPDTSNNELKKDL